MQIYDIQIDSKRMETTQIGTFEFPMVVHENELKKNVLGFVNWHWHYEFQLSYVVRGKISVFFNQNIIDLEEGQGIYMNPEVLHMIRDREDSDAMFVSLDVNPKLLTSFPNSVFERSYVRPVFQNAAADAVVLDPQTPWQRRILEEAAAIRAIHKERSFGWELAVSSSLYALWKELAVHLQESLKSSDAPAADGARQRRDQRIKDVLAYIREHYAEKLTLDEIAQHLHISTNECCRFFKKNMNCTLFEYITEFRLSRSMELLEQTDLPVARIADETGFGSSSYFIEKFRKNVGMTPAAFRKAGGVKFRME